MTRFAIATLFILLCVTAPVSALESFDFEQELFLELGPEVKDHALLKADGVFHLFYIRGNPGVSFGHATSTDLRRWTLQQPVMNPGPPGSWDDKALWAPQILKHPSGAYMMYFTGVNTASAQQAGIALSNDLDTWTKLSYPVYHPNPLTWALWDITEFSHARDPFVLQHDGTWYMLNTAKTWFDKGAISLASSTNMVNWQDEGPLYVNDSWHVMESVQCIKRNGFFYLFFTEETVGGTSVMRSSDFFDWSNSPKQSIDSGHASEVNEIDGEWIFSRHSVHNNGDGTYQFAIRFDDVGWLNDNPYIIEPWPLVEDWTIISGNAFISQPTFLNNPALRGENVDVGYQGHSWLSSYEYYQGPMGIGNEGLIQGDFPTGVMRSRTFTLGGRSINLLVGGTNMPDDVYVALVDAGSGQIIHKETGNDTDEMDRRAWDLRGYVGVDVYLEIADNSTSGHISVDDIRESQDVVDFAGEGDGEDKDKPFFGGAPGAGLPGPAVLHQNSPNPFNPSTTISFSLAERASVELEIFDVQGKLVRSLASGKHSAGPHTQVWDGKNTAGQTLSSGIFFYRLTVNGGVIDTRKMILLK